MEPFSRVSSRGGKDIRRVNKKLSCDKWRTRGEGNRVAHGLHLTGSCI